MKTSKLGFIAILMASVIAPAQVSGQSADADLRSLFNRIDHDRNGYLSRYEYVAYYETAVAPGINQQYGDRGREALEKIHADNRRKLIDGPLESGDQNQDGRLSFTEYKAYNDSLVKL